MVGAYFHFAKSRSREKLELSPAVFIIIMIIFLFAGLFPYLRTDTQKAIGVRL